MRRARRGSPRLRSVGEGSQYGDGARGRTALPAPSARGYLLLRRGTRQRPGARRGGPGGGGLRGLRRSGALLGAAVGHGRGGHVRLDLGRRAGRRHDHRPPLLPPRPPDRSRARPYWCTCGSTGAGRTWPRPAASWPPSGSRAARRPSTAARRRPVPGRAVRLRSAARRRSPLDVRGPAGAVPLRRHGAGARSRPGAATSRPRRRRACPRPPQPPSTAGPRGAPDRCVDAVGRDRERAPRGRSTDTDASRAAARPLPARRPRSPGRGREPHRRLAVGRRRPATRPPGARGRHHASDPAAPAGVHPLGGGRRTVRAAVRGRPGRGPSTRRASPRRRGSRCRRSSASRGPGIRARSVASSRVSAG